MREINIPNSSIHYRDKVRIIFMKGSFVNGPCWIGSFRKMQVNSRGAVREIYTNRSTDEL